MTTTLDQRIAALLPGQIIFVSGDPKLYCTAERSGDGKTLRFIRHTSAGFAVFRAVIF